MWSDMSQEMLRTAQYQMWNIQCKNHVDYLSIYRTANMVVTQMLLVSETLRDETTDVSWAFHVLFYLRIARHYLEAKYCVTSKMRIPKQTRVLLLT